ncbi:MAG: hypothetical protein R2911_40650 [Caldilineaceae bacterium]
MRLGATPAVINGLLAFSQSSGDEYAVVSALRSLLQLGYETDTVVQRLHCHSTSRGDMVVRSVVLRALGLVQQPSPAALTFAYDCCTINTRNHAMIYRARLRQTDPNDPQWTALFMASLETAGHAQRDA